MLEWFLLSDDVAIVDAVYGLHFELAFFVEGSLAVLGCVKELCTEL